MNKNSTCSYSNRAKMAKDFSHYASRQGMINSWGQEDMSLSLVRWCNQCIVRSFLSSSDVPTTGCYHRQGIKLWKPFTASSFAGFMIITIPFCSLSQLTKPQMKNLSSLLFCRDNISFTTCPLAKGLTLKMRIKKKSNAKLTKM